MISLFFINDEFCQRHFDMIPLALSTLAILRKDCHLAFTSLEKVLTFLFAMSIIVSK